MKVFWKVLDALFSTIISIGALILLLGTRELIENFSKNQIETVFACLPLFLIFFSIIFFPINEYIDAYIDDDLD